MAQQIHRTPIPLHPPAARTEAATDLHQMLRHAPVTLYVCEPIAEFPLLYVSPTVAHLLGYEPEAFLSRPDFWVGNLHPDDRATVLRERASLVPYEVLLRKYRFRRSDGTWKWIRDRARLVGEPGKQQIVGAWNDITELIDAEEALRNSEAKHRFLLDNINAGVLVYAADSRVVYSNKQAEMLLGRSHQALCEMSLAELQSILQHEDGSPLALDELPPVQVILHRRPLENKVVGIRTRPDQEPLWAIINAFPDLNVDGQIREVVVTLLDITARVRAQRRIHRLAHYDALTDLPNRTLVVQRIDRAIARARQSRGYAALLFLDLNDFKIVNDSLGHAFGDQLLRQVAERLVQGVRETDTVGRLGGDEFLVILPDADRDAAANVADKISEQLSLPFEIDGQRICVRASIGISLYPEHGGDHAILVRHADAAMYHAKESGRRHYVFGPSLRRLAENPYTLEHDLRAALEREQFRLHYQPQVNLRTGCIDSVEALLRWHHPERGWIAPMEFIPVAEQSRLIQPIGKWIIAQACRDMRAWAAQGQPCPRMALNLSLRQLQEQDFLPDMIRIIEESDIDFAHIEWEITETTMMRDPERMLDFMHACRARGIRFALDDFGTGYSSLSLLQRLPVDRIKIDRAFINDLDSSPNARAIVGAIVDMASRLALSVVAEGVETDGQLDYLRQIRCESVQGFLFSRPLERDALLPFMAAHKSNPMTPTGVAYN